MNQNKRSSTTELGKCILLMAPAINYGTKSVVAFAVHACMPQPLLFSPFSGRNVVYVCSCSESSTLDPSTDAATHTHSGKNITQYHWPTCFLSVIGVPGMHGQSVTVRQEGPI